MSSGQKACDKYAEDYKYLCSKWKQKLRYAPLSMGYPDDEHFRELEKLEDEEKLSKKESGGSGREDNDTSKTNR